MLKTEHLVPRIQNKLLDTTRETEFRTVGHFFTFLLSHKGLFTEEEARSLANYSEKFVCQIVSQEGQYYPVTLKDLLRSSKEVRQNCLATNLELKIFSGQEIPKILTRLNQIAATLPLIS